MNSYRSPIPRRRFLAGAASVGALAGVSGLATGRPPSAHAATDEDFAALLTKWQAFLTGGPQDLSDPAVQAAIATRDASTDDAVSLIDPDPNRTAVFTDLPFDPNDDRRSRAVAFGCARLKDMALSWATDGSRHYGSTGLLDQIVAGVETVTTHNYLEGVPEDYSWYNNEIAIPQYMNNALALVREHLSDDLIATYAGAVDWYVPDPKFNYPPDDPDHKPSTGGNRLDLCEVVIVRGVLDGTAERVQIGSDAIGEVLGYTTSEDGFYRDGGFIQHRWVPYTATYGTQLLNGAASLLSLLTDSPWNVTDPNVEVLFDSVENCYAAVVYDNQVFSHVAGRAVSRKGRVEHGPALDFVDGILTLAPAVDIERAKSWREMCLGWLNRDTYADPFATSDLRRLGLFRDLLDDQELIPAPEPVGHQLMSSVARPVHRRGDWTFTVSMARQGVLKSYEEQNNENLHGWYQGRGMSYLYVRNDNAQFSDAFWPTVDPLRLPGTTVQRRELADGEYQGAYGHFAGGACVDGEFAATGMRLSHAPDGGSLTALKSWFCLDDRIVALGSNITSTAADLVQSVMENRNLHESGTNTVLVDGTEALTAMGEDVYLGRPDWIHLEDVAGYVILLKDRGSPLRGLREERTATWLDINPYWSTHDDTPYTRRYVTLYFGHGRAPTSKEYAYQVLPGATAQQTSERAANNDVRVLANTQVMHAISVERLGFAGVNFFSGGGYSAPHIFGGEVSADKVSSVVFRQQGDTLVVGIANPTHRIDSLNVSLTGLGFSPAASDSTVSFGQSGETVHINVNTSARDGRTHRATLTR